jgi:hypothetical protein
MRGGICMCDIDIPLYLTKFRKASVYITETNRRHLPRMLLSNHDYFIYDIRHADDDWDRPVSIEKRVFVNHWGVLISDTKLLKDDVDFDYLTKREIDAIYKLRNGDEGIETRSIVNYYL